MELGIPYVLTSPDGIRAVFGNSDTAKMDVDWVGYLDPENGITGLLDGADIRSQPVELVAGDGGDVGPAFLGLRPGTIQVILDPNVAFATREGYEQRLKRASRGLRADCELRWTPTADGIERCLRLRRTARPAPSGRHPRSIQLSMTSGEPYVLSGAETSQVVDPAVGEIGVADPVTDPMTSLVDEGAALLVANLGDAESWPRFRIDGPITNPQILNQTTGERIALGAVIGTYEYLMIYPEFGQVLLGAKQDISGVLFDVPASLQDRYEYVDFAATDWWQLVGGNNDVRVLSASFSAGAQVTVWWRHAWE